MVNEPVIFVDIKQGLSVLKRKQQWYWTAKNAANQRVLARSSERYTNHADCVAAVEQLFGDNTIVFRRETDKAKTLLRRPE